MRLLLAALFAISASAQDLGSPKLRWLELKPMPAPIEFHYHLQTSNPFPNGTMPGFPSLPPEFEKAGILVGIKNCTGCTKYTVRVTYYRVPPFSEDRRGTAVEEVTVDRMEPNSNGGGSTFAVVWLGKTRADHQILKVEVEALAVVAKSYQEAK